MIGKNNPFNIRNNRHNKWLGQIGSKKGFCCFSEMKYGVRAAAIILKNYYQRFNIKTIEGIIKRFAPPEENNTKLYIDFVSDRVGIHSKYVIMSDHQFVRVLEAMSVYEGNSVPLYDIIQYLVITNFNFPLYEKENNKFD